MMERGVFRGMAIGFALLAIAAAFRLAPIQDETYYWAWSRAPALTYVDHPPAVAWILALGQLVFGTGRAGLRFPTIAAMVLVVLACTQAAKRMSGARGATLAALALFGAPMFAVGYLPATPDPFQGAAAAIAAYAIVRAFEKSRAWMFAASFVLVASVLIKHSSALLAIGALGGALATRDGRAILKDPATWLGAACGAAVIAPWLYADLTSGDGSITYQATRIFARGTTRGIGAIGVLLGGILLALGPLSGALLIALGGREMKRRDPLRTVLFAGSLLLLGVCLLPVWMGGGELNWSMPALAFAAPALAAAIAEQRGKLEKIAYAGGLASMALLAILLAHIVHPFLPISAKKDTTQRGAGFDRLASRALELAKENNAKTIITRRYQAASMLRYHTDDLLPVFELGTSRKSQYDVWPRPPLCAGDVALVVLQESTLPPELPLSALATPESFGRKAGDEELDRWTLTAVRVEHNVHGPCAQREVAQRSTR